MSNVSVTILTPNGRRQNVKVLPNKTILQILEEVCEKHKFSPTEYDLKHHKRILDLSQPFRFAGLPNNAQIEMIERTGKQRTEEDVTLMVQLEDGTRLPGVYAPNTTLMDVLKNVCPDKANAKDLVIVYMRSEVFGDALITTTLKSLGLTSGRAAIRLMQKNPDLLKTQANVSAPLVAKPVLLEEEKDSEQTNQPSSSKSPIDIIKTLKESTKTENMSTTKSIEVEEPMETGSAPEETEIMPNQKKFKVDDTAESSSGAASKQTQPVDRISEEELNACLLGEKYAILYSLQSTECDSISSIDDAFFELDIKDIQVLWRDLKAKAQELHDQPLLTAGMREIEYNSQTLTKLSKYKECVIRIQFPNRLVFQATFLAINTIGDVMDFLRSHFKESNIDFYLYTTPPKGILDKSQTLVELHFVPAALVYFGCEDNTLCNDLFKAEYIEKLTKPNVARLVALKSRKLEEQLPLDYEVAGSSKRVVGGTFKKTSVSTPESGAPKWFKGSGK